MCCHTITEEKAEIPRRGNVLRLPCLDLYSFTYMNRAFPNL